MATALRPLTALLRLVAPGAVERFGLDARRLLRAQAGRPSIALSYRYPLPYASGPAPVAPSWRTVSVYVDHVYVEQITGYRHRSHVVPVEPGWHSIELAGDGLDVAVDVEVGGPTMVLVYPGRGRRHCESGGRMLVRHDEDEARRQDSSDMRINRWSE